MGSDPVVDFYEYEYDEAERLLSGPGLLEALRTKELLSEVLPANAIDVVDVGGGPGVYAEWLASLGHRVTLIDPSERHVASAASLPTRDGDITAVVGDARELNLDDASADMVLLLGPLYHLPDRQDREQALAEAVRVLRPGGHLFAAAISRFASLHDGIASGWITNESFRFIARNDLETGRHENPSRHPGWFTTAYFHRPDEFHAEVDQAGLEDVKVFGVEGIAGWFSDLDDRLADPNERENILQVLRQVQSEPSLLGASSHLLAHARKTV